MDDDPTRVLFLAGMGRSGTTLLERALGAVPGVAALGEVMHLWRRGVDEDELCGCGTAFSACPFWQQVGARAFGGWSAVDVAQVEREREAVDHVRHVPGLLVRRASGRTGRQRSYADRYVRLYTAARQVSGAQVLVDSSKQASLPHVLAGAPGLDLRVLHVVRDPRAVCHAWAKEVVRPETRDGALMPRYPARTMAAMWSRHNVAVELLAAQGVPVRRLRYEDFLVDPPGTLASVADFAGLPTGAAELSGIGASSVQLSVDHTAAGNPVRFARGELPLRRDEVWRTAMPTADRRLVTRRTWPLLARYGYPSLRRPSSLQIGADQCA